MDSPSSSIPDSEQLRDIRGMDITMGDIWFGYGWRILLVLTVLLALVLLVKYIRKYLEQRKRAAWADTAERAFDYLLEQVGKAESKALLGTLEELLKRVVFATHGRADVASLTGIEWLKWLSEHDPHSFDWQSHGRVMIEASYARSSKATIDEVQQLILAARAWARSYT